MSRPQKNRSAHRPSLHSGFNPTGVGRRYLENFALALDEFELTFNSETTRCPDCGSPILAGLADGFGHGRCCHQHRGNGRI